MGLFSADLQANHSMGSVMGVLTQSSTGGNIYSTDDHCLYQEATGRSIE